MDLWTGPLRGLPDFRALGRSPVDGRMDNPAGCPRVHPQAVGCPQAPQGSTTNDRNPQVKTPRRDQPSWSLSTHSEEPLDRPIQQPSYNAPRATQPPSPPAVTMPKSSVTFAEMRSRADAGIFAKHPVPQACGANAHGMWTGYERASFAIPGRLLSCLTTKILTTSALMR